MSNFAPSRAMRALAELELRRRRRASETLLDFIPRISPRWERPEHLAKLCDIFERIRRREPVRVAFSVPPRHGKTETIMHGLAQLVAETPSLQLCYATYAQRLAEKKSRKIRDLSVRAGCPLAKDSRSRADWRTGVDDGGLWATSIGGSVTGEGFHVVVVDDSVKSRATAESIVERDKAYEWLKDDILTRVEPNGSILVNATRWHEDDLIGRLIAEGWDYVNLPAIDDDGDALWPERWPVELLRAREAALGPYGWFSLFQGKPRGRDTKVFRDVHYYTELPSRFRIGIGFDLAYSAKTRADWSVAVVLAECDGRYYILDVRRRQCEAPEFAAVLGELANTYPGAPMHWFTSTTEKGLAHLLRDLADIPVEPELAAADKFVRAQPVAAAWNDPQRRILLPQSAPWLKDFIKEIVAFTGVGDRHDDQVDALTSAFAAVAQQGTDASGLEIATLGSDDSPIG